MTHANLLRPSAPRESAPAGAWRRWPATARIGAVLALMLTALVHAPLHAQTVRLGGTGSGLGVMRLLANEHRQREPTFTLDVVASLGSSGGLKALRAGAIDVAVISRPLKADEAAAGLRAIELGRTAFVLATAKDSVSAVSLAQVAELYAGRRAQWPDGQPVRLVLRPASDADTELLAAFSPAVREALTAAMAREGMVSALTDQEAVDEIERLPGGLGTSTMVLLLSEQRRARPLSLDGVAPTLDNVAGGRYPHTKPLLLVLRGAPSPAIEKFLAHVASADGRRLLQRSGVVVDPRLGGAGRAP